MMKDTYAPDIFNSIAITVITTYYLQRLYCTIEPKVEEVIIY